MDGGVRAAFRTGGEVPVARDDGGDTLSTDGWGPSWASSARPKGTKGACDHAAPIAAGGLCSGGTVVHGRFVAAGAQPPPRPSRSARALVYRVAVAVAGFSGHGCFG
ncbi:hypothetical protein M2168_005011 [Streptomyces sp. CZ24]|nr:hypothetical protein [Streptomyces sp. CZ24]